MDSKKLTISDGRETYEINDSCKISFNPTDLVFVERVFNCMMIADQYQTELETRVQDAQKQEQIQALFDLSREADAKIREIIDDTLGAGVCNSCFPDVNIYARARGLPLWVNLLLAIIDEFEDGAVAQQKLTKPRLAKYISKYHK